MPKFFSIVSRFFFFTVSTILLLASFGFAVMQTKWFLKKIETTLIEEAAANHLRVTLGELSGSPPLKWSLSSITIEWEDGSCMKAENIKMRLSILPLLKKNITIHFLSMDRADLFFSTRSSLDTKQREWAPLSLRLETLKCRELFLHDLSRNLDLGLSFHAQAKIKTGFQDLSIDLAISELEQRNHLRCSLRGGSKTESIQAFVQWNVAHSETLVQWLNLPFQTALQGELSIKGPFAAWQSFVNQKDLTTSPLDFQAVSHIDKFDLPGFSFLNRAWDIEAKGSVDPTFSFSLDQLSIESPWLHFFANKELAEFSIDDLSLFSPLLPVSLGGKLQGKLSLGNETIKAEINSPNLELNQLVYESASFSFQAKRQNETWIGISQAHLPQSDLPLDMDCEFSFAFPELKIPRFTLSSGSALASGNFSWDLSSQQIAVSMFACVDELRPFRSFFPRSEISGSLGAELHFSHGLESSLSVHGLFKNVRYQNFLFHSLLINGEISNPFSTPKGKIDLEGEQALLGEIFLSNFSFSSKDVSETEQTFAIQAIGSWKEDLACTASGLWQKTAERWQIDIETLFGKAMGHPFSLASPSRISQHEKNFDIELSQLAFGDGKISCLFRQDAEGVFFKTEGQHIPLGLMRLLHPQIGIDGSCSLEGRLEGKRENMQGALSLILEQAKIASLDKKGPLQAKGSLQIHFHPKAAQVQAHLYAMNQQFLDWTATIPLSYSQDPFGIHIDRHRPIASELIVQGAFEEIFDFINSGSHKASGLATAHLFLSQTLEHPAVIGEIELQNGSYENYYTGTSLQKIEAKIEATQSTFSLTSFHCHDRDFGSLKAQGSLLLDPQNHFPFHLKASLDQIELIRSETIEGAFSGPLTITGNTLSAKMEGDLLVPRAEIKIFDSLPYETPVLPVVFKNRPIHLHPAPEVISYPFETTVHLTAKDHVFVKGRGLSSEWQGDVQVSGIGTNFTANGTLHLVKGEFLFSGKTFTLTQGEISFSDKPSASAYLKIHGQLQMSNAMVLAQMQGPLTSPTLTFQSIPHLPTSSILSMILFNKDISEITALQAIQLAQVIMSLSGNSGPDVLEAIRKSIGIDRLNIVGKDDSDEISVQIGWYLTHGVTVTLSQSVTSSDVTIEVDLKNGFIFQAETQNQEEGKFSLKWNKNY